MSLDINRTFVAESNFNARCVTTACSSNTSIGKARDVSDCNGIGDSAGGTNRLKVSSRADGGRSSQHKIEYDEHGFGL